MRDEKGVSDAERNVPTSSENHSASIRSPSRGEIAEEHGLLAGPAPPISPTSPLSPSTPPEGEIARRPLLTIDTNVHGPSSAVSKDPYTPGAIRIRRMDSLTRETEAIEDEESRRLTEIAFLC